MALATVDHLTFAYPGSGPALHDVSLAIEEGEVVVLLGASGSGKSTLLRALAGLVPHFHGGRFAGRVVVGGLDTREAPPAALTGTVASVFQDPEDQVVMTLAGNEVAFGLENLGVAPAAIWPRVRQALAGVGIAHLFPRRTHELSGGELQRLCLASALALEPRLLLLDEPTSQLDVEAADSFLHTARTCGAAVLLSEQRVERAIAVADRVVFLEHGRVLLDAPREEAVDWLEEMRPRYGPGSAGRDLLGSAPVPDEVVRFERIRFSYGAGPIVLNGIDLSVGRGEIVALEGQNGSGKTTVAKLAAGLLEPTGGRVVRTGNATYLSQDPGRYLARESVLDEVALAVHGDADRGRAALAAFGLTHLADRHPRDLSSGERERLAIAAVSVAEPDLLILDEPTRGVDPDRKAELGAWLETEAAAGRAILVATHDRSLPAHRRVRVGAPMEVSVAA